MESFTIIRRCLLLGSLVVCCSPSQAAGWRHRLRRFNTPTFYDDSPFGRTSLWDDGGSVFDHHASVFDHRWMDSPFIMRPFAFHHNSYPWHCGASHRTPVISNTHTFHSTPSLCSRCDHSNVLPEGSQNTIDVPSDTVSNSKQSMNGSPEPPTTTQQRFPPRDNIFNKPADQYHDEVVGTNQLGNHDGPIRQKEPFVDQYHHNTEDSPNTGDPQRRRHHTEKFVDPRLEGKRMDNLRNQQRHHQSQRHESDNPNVDESNMRSQRNRQPDQLITSLQVKGYKARHISVNVEGNQIIVKGKLDCPCEADCVESSFERRYNIPHYIDEQSISARLDNNGVLQISGKRKTSNNRPQTGTFQVDVQGDGDSETETIHCRSKTEAKRPGIQLAKFNRKTGKVTLIKEAPRSSGREYPQHVENDDDASIEVVE